MAGELLPWDTAYDLKSIDDVCLYLEAAAEEDPGDGSVICMAVINIARAERMGTLDRLAQAACTGLYDELADGNRLNLNSFVRLTASLGMRIHLEMPHELEKRLTLEMEQTSEHVGLAKIDRGC